MTTPSNLQWQLEHIHDDRASAIVISHAIVIPLALIAVVLRFVSRHLCRARILADDFMIVAALVCSSPDGTDLSVCMRQVYMS